MSYFRGVIVALFALAATVCAIPSAQATSNQTTATLTHAADGGAAPPRLRAFGRVTVAPRDARRKLVVDLQRLSGRRWVVLATRPLPASHDVQISVLSSRISVWPTRVRFRVRFKGTATIAAITRSSVVARATVSPTVQADSTPAPAFVAPAPDPPAPDPPAPDPPAVEPPTPEPTTPVSTTPLQTTPVDTTPTTPPLGSVPTGTLPLLTIAVDGGAKVVSKESYLGADLKLGDLTARTEIKGRGNSTWEMPKKPYRLKLQTKASLLGMPSSRHWVLLADYADPSLLRNEIAFELGRRSRLAWTPKQMAVEVVFNGKYVGVYHLTEQVRVDTTRVNIKPSKAADDPSKGGYLLERDAYLDVEPQVDCSADGLGLRPPGFTTPSAGGVVPGGHNPILLHDPECHTANQLTWIENHLHAFEQKLYGASYKDPTAGYAPYIDVPSFIDWALVQEVSRNIDAWYKSVWFYKADGGPLFMGPLWDFDITFGSPYTVEAGWTSSPVSPEGAGQALSGNGWLTRLFSDPAFDALARQRWAVFRTDVLAMRDYVKSRAATLRTAALANQARWPRPTTFDGNLAILDDWLTRRVAWLDQRFSFSE